LISDRWIEAARAQYYYWLGWVTRFVPSAIPMVFEMVFVCPVEGLLTESRSKFPFPQPENAPESLCARRMAISIASGNIFGFLVSAVSAAGQ